MFFCSRFAIFIGLADGSFLAGKLVLATSPLSPVAVTFSRRPRLHFSLPFHEARLVHVRTECLCHMLGNLYPEDSVLTVLETAPQSMRLPPSVQLLVRFAAPT